MADSDNTTTLSFVTRRKASAGRAATALLRNNLAEQSSDPAAVVWRNWRAAHTEVGRLCRHQQRLEADRTPGTGGVRDYAAALRAESEAGELAVDLLGVLSETPASSLAGIAAKLDAVLGEGEPSEGDTEFPWPQLRSALEDLIRIGRLGEPPFADGAARQTGTGSSA
ncbi:hypothetical protein [Mesorhizobium sp. NPDC059025]|uniref:hypothetical protein n=1 Tax=unclassified Mesorhizobium TaxID=325217 RepID=UPI0036BE5435